MNLRVTDMIGFSFSPAQCMLKQIIAASVVDWKTMHTDLLSDA